MKTLKNIQIVATAFGMLLALNLASKLEPTSAELMASVALTVVSGVSLFTVLLATEKKEEENVD